jgi:hypothetical protein
MADHEPQPKLAQLDGLGREIQSALREDKVSGGKLKYGSSEDSANEFDCYCAVASEAYFYLSGAARAGLDPRAPDIDWEEAGKEALATGLQPMQLTLFERHGIWPLRHDERSSHWWIKRPGTDGKDEVVDLTVGPDDVRDTTYPYTDGRARGFQQHGYKGPSKERGLPLIEMIVQRRHRPLNSAN